MNWMNRLVDMSTSNGGEPWYELREVYFDEAGRPMGHAKCCMGSETMEGMVTVVRRFREALGYPMLSEADFPANSEPLGGNDDESVLGRIDIIEKAILDMSAELRSMKHKVEDDISKAAWPNWGDRPDGFDGPGGAE